MELWDTGHDPKDHSAFDAFSAGPDIERIPSVSSLYGSERREQFSTRVRVGPMVRIISGPRSPPPATRFRRRWRGPGVRRRNK